ncbi:hypothetical protein BJX96DRAFT_121402 [Aspergillus floccosus]
MRLSMRCSASSRRRLHHHSLHQQATTRSDGIPISRQPNNTPIYVTDDPTHLGTYTGLCLPFFANTSQPWRARINGPSNRTDGYPVEEAECAFLWPAPFVPWSQRLLNRCRAWPVRSVERSSVGRTVMYQVGCRTYSVVFGCAGGSWDKCLSWSTLW